MATKVQIPTPMREQAGGNSEVEVAGATVKAALDDLVRQHPAMAAKLFDNGKLQPLTQFDNSPQPIRLIVLIDVSGSMEGNLRLLRGASEELIRRLGERDLVRVGTFGDVISISPTFTRDTAAIAAWLPQEIPPNARTPLWQAVDQAMGEFTQVTEGRRVILVLSDGKDSGPMKFGQKFLSPIEIGDRAQRDDVMIYGVGVYGSLNSAMRSGAQGVAGVLGSTFPDPGLGGVALDTGGGYIELRSRDNLSAVFGRVVDELHQQYLLGFAPPARDGKTHKIEVKINRNTPWKVRRAIELVGEYVDIDLIRSRLDIN
jgi:VWFA-related protein